MGKEEENSGFTVTDKRAFREDGGKRETGSGEGKQRQPEPRDPAPAGDSTILGEQPGAEPRIDFPSYILSYYTQGLVLLGEVPNPMTGKKEDDLEGARHTIDIMSMLQEKTRGNLSGEEEQLMDSVLYELRMKFMAKTRKIKL